VIRRHLFKCVVVCSAMLTVMLSAGVAPASATTPGWVDTTYGTGGATVVPGAVFGNTIVDDLGRALVLGAANASGGGSKITRLLTTGGVDTTFGSGGTFVLNPSYSFSRLAIDPAGRLYALGIDTSSSTFFIVTRVTAGGGVDSTFGTNGDAAFRLPASVTAAQGSLAVRPDGSVVVSLLTADTANVNNRGYLAALTTAGALDTTFGPQPSTGIFPMPAKTFVFKLAPALAPIAPHFTADTPPLTANKAVAYAGYTFKASGRPAPKFYVHTGALPPGLTLNAVTGVLSGTPTATGDYTFTVAAINGTSPYAVSPSLTIHVGPTPTSPIFTNASPTTPAAKGAAYTYTFTAGGTPAPTFAVASGSLPTGLTLDTTTGVLSGTPTVSGAFTFTVKASNGVSPDATTGPLTINVTAPPVFTASAPPNTGSIGVAYSYTFQASGFPAPTFSVVSGTLPTGLALNGTTGVLSGTPTAVGQFHFQVQATNGIAPVALTPTETISVTNGPVAPHFTADTPPTTATVGVSYSYQFAASGNPAPSFIVAGQLPTGLSLNSTTGLLSGTPTAAHSFSFRVIASNGVGTAATSPLITITVARAPAAAATPVATPAAATASGPTSDATPTSADTSTVVNHSNDVVALVADDTTATRTWVLRRYISTGTPDTTFGTGGSTAVFPAADNPTFVVEAADGSYYVTGNNGQSIFIGHVLATGAFDSAFGTGGFVVGPVESCKPTGGQILFSGSDLYVIAIDSDFAACGASPAIVMRFHNGAPDATFGVGGEVRIDSVGAMRVSGPNGGGLQPSGQVLVGLNGAAAPATASAAVTRVNPAASGPTIEAFTQLTDDSHFAAATVAPNPSGTTYIGPVAATADGGGTTHVFATGANHDLFEFNQTGATTWAAPIDLTATTTGALPVISAPKAIFDGTNLDVFALGAGGDLIQYRNNGTAGAWTTTDINTVVGSGSAHVTNIDPRVIGGVLHVYGIAAGGDLVEIVNDNASGHAWNIYDLTATGGGGVTIAGGPAGLVIGGTPHVYTRAASNNHLVEYVADHAGGKVWNAYDTTAAASAAPAIAGNPVPTIIGSTPHIYTVSAVNGDLVEYAADHLNGSVWNAYDQTTGADAPKPVGNISVVLIDGTPYGIGQAIPEVWETTAAGELTTIVADHRLSHIWNVYDVTALSGGTQAIGDPTPIVNGSTVQVFGLGKASTTTGAAVSAAKAAPAAAGAPTTFASTWLGAAR
jgi:uncharacterized delta-60 repeat protein